MATNYQFTSIDVPDGQMTNMVVVSDTEVQGADEVLNPGGWYTGEYVTDNAGAISTGPVPSNVMVGGPTVAPGYVISLEPDSRGIMTYQVNGTPIEPPAAVLTGMGSLGAATSQQFVDSEPRYVDDQGTVVGAFEDSAGKDHGFIDQNGVYTQIDVPGSTQTALQFIDDNGDIAGNYTDAAGATHNFVGEVGKYAGVGTPIPGSDNATPMNPPGGVSTGPVNTPPPDNFSLTDTSNGQTSQQVGEAYSGPVAGLTNEYINISADNLNITANIPNTFLHSGSGEDALNVQAAGGNNVLDGGTGSNFLVGGSGTDQFFLDDRNAAATLWSTVVNMHSGDNATIWGITAQDFSVSWLDNQGAAGFTGLTGVFNGHNGQPQAAISLSGFSSADLNNGKLSVSFGSTPDTPGLPGSNYMQIHAN